MSAARAFRQENESLQPVAIRKLFATAIDLALGNEVPLHAYSLARFWETDSPQEIARPVVSELSASLSEADAAGISLTTAQWHYILTTKGEQYLYNWATDPAEKDNLSASPQGQQIAAGLKAKLGEIEANSAEPWIGTGIPVRAGVRRYLGGSHGAAHARPKSAC